VIGPSAGKKIARHCCEAFSVRPQQDVQLVYGVLTASAMRDNITFLRLEPNQPTTPVPLMGKGKLRQVALLWAALTACQYAHICGTEARSQVRIENLGCSGRTLSKCGCLWVIDTLVLRRRKRLPRTLSRTEASDLISAQVPNLARVGGDRRCFEPSCG